MLVVVLAAGSAQAGTLHGDKAGALTQGLRYAGVKPATAKDTRTFRAATLECVRMLGTDNVLGDHKCTLDKAEIKDVAAYLLYTALMDAELPSMVMAPDDIHVKTANVVCVAKTTKDLDDRFQCTFEGGGKPQPVQITPKKVKVKDVVQPIKIEKQ